MDTRRAVARDHIARQLEEARQSTRRLLEKAFRNWYYPIRHQHFRGFLCARQALMSQAEMLTS